MVSARPRPLYVDASLLWREWPLLRPGGGFEIVEPVPWENGGDLNLCCVFGGGAAGCGPVAFRLRGDSPTACCKPR